MPRLLLSDLALALAAPAAAQQANPQVDYAGFLRLAQQLEPVREAHRIPWTEFRKKARAGNALLLDARSESAYRRGHIKGAVNLPFSDFTDAALRAVIAPASGAADLYLLQQQFHRQPRARSDQADRHGA